MTEMMPTKIPHVVTRHSRDLVQLIRDLQAKVPDVLEHYESNHWFIKSGEKIIAGPCDTQWEAWHFAAENMNG